MAIGVGAVILLTSLGEGARRYVTEQFASIGSNLIIVFPGRNETTGFFPGAIGVPHDLTLEDVEAILRSVPRGVAHRAGGGGRGDGRQRRAAPHHPGDGLDARHDRGAGVQHRAGQLPARRRRAPRRAGGRARLQDRDRALPGRAGGRRLGAHRRPARPGHRRASSRAASRSASTSTTSRSSRWRPRCSSSTAPGCSG